MSTAVVDGLENKKRFNKKVDEEWSIKSMVVVLAVLVCVVVEQFFPGSVVGVYRLLSNSDISLADPNTTEVWFLTHTTAHN